MNRRRNEPTEPRARSRGAALLACMILGVLVFGLMMASMTVAQATNRWFRHLIAETQALAMAEAATELRQKALLADIANFADEAVLTEPRTNTIVSGGQPFTLLSRVGRIGLGGGAATSDFKVSDFDGVVVYVSYFELTGRAIVGTTTAEVRRTIQVGQTPLFQYGVFYNADLEILPGPEMTVGGRVHANGNIYLNGGTVLRLATPYVHCTGEIFREPKFEDAMASGTTLLWNRTTSEFVEMTADNCSADRLGLSRQSVYYDNFDDDPNLWVQYADATWGGTVMTQAHGIRAVAIPSIQTMSPGGYYHENAGLVIEYNGSSISVIQRVNGVPSTITSTLPAGTVTLGTIYDARERATLSTIEVDMAKLRDAGVMPANGLVYAYRTDTRAARPHGILLTNGKELGAPLMLVTPDPLYIQGDFNAPDAASSRTKEPALVICDAINVLSNAWDNTKTSTSLVPAASPTEINLAIASGIVPTPDTGGSYSGGLENFTRLHENWTGVELKVRGSFMCFHPSVFATSTFPTATFSAPLRNWAFDPDLLGREVEFAREIIPWAVDVRRMAWQDNAESMLD